MGQARAAAEFYFTARGAVAARLLRDRLVALWPDMAGQRVLGVGYPAPYLRPWREAAACCIAAVPAQLGMARWPAGQANLCCSIDEEMLPFPDLSFDRVLLVHGLELAGNGRRLLREIWRVMKDDARLIVVAPNRIGLWAHFESTPFGQGAPYSPSQIGQLLAEGLFHVERRESALYLPPVRLRMVLRGGRLCERLGRQLVPQFAGVTITEAVKDLYAAEPKRLRLRRLVLSEAA